MTPELRSGLIELLDYLYNSEWFDPGEPHPVSTTAWAVDGLIHNRGRIYIQNGSVIWHAHNGVMYPIGEVEYCNAIELVSGILPTYLFVRYHSGHDNAMASVKVYMGNFTC